MANKLNNLEHLLYNMNKLTAPNNIHKNFSVFVILLFAEDLFVIFEKSIN